MKKLLVALVIVLILIPPADANFFEELLSPFQQLADEIEEELERSRIGRELNRIVEDIEAVAQIVEEFDDLASLVTSGVTPVGIANLAIQYGHDPDQLFDRFKERADSLEDNKGQELSETEIAAALQSVLEEPPLPEGVYMGDPCIIDLTACPDNPPVLGDYNSYSCYVEGAVSKKRINNLNKAACVGHWLDPITGRIIEMRFPVDTQGTTYQWERCARVKLTQEEQEQFLASRSQVCDQPVAKYEVGDACVVDYTSCSYGAGGNLNANRIGTIQYGLIGNVRQYACRTTYATAPLKESLRQSCETVYVGDREVEEFLEAHPEPARAPPAQPAVGQQVFEEGSVPISLGDIRQSPEQLGRVTAVYGRNGIIDAAPPTVQERREVIEDRLLQLGALDEFSTEDFEKRVIGKKLSGLPATLFGNERAEIYIRQNYGEDILICVTIKDGAVESFALCSEETSFEPTVRIQTSQSVIEEVDSMDGISMALEDKRITYEATGLGNKVKFGVSSFFIKTFV